MSRAGRVDVYLDKDGDCIKDADEPSADRRQRQVSFSVKPGADQRVCEVLKATGTTAWPGHGSRARRLEADLESGETASRYLGNYRNATMRA